MMSMVVVEVLVIVGVVVGVVVVRSASVVRALGVVVAELADSGGCSLYGEG